MSDAAITSIVSGVVTVALTGIGFLTLWVKLKYGVEKSLTTAAQVATTAVDRAHAQLANVNAKTDTIVEQTNGASEKTRNLIENISERVAKIEEYHHNSTHRLANALNVLSLKVTALITKCHPELNDIVPLPPKEEVKQ